MTILNEHQHTNKRQFFISRHKQTKKEQSLSSLQQIQAKYSNISIQNFPNKQSNFSKCLWDRCRKHWQLSIQASYIAWHHSIQVLTGTFQSRSFVKTLVSPLGWLRSSPC